MAKLMFRKVPEALELVLSPLPTPMQISVLNAHDAWRKAGLSDEDAIKEAAKYASHVTKKRRTTLKRLKGHPVSQAAAKHERAVEQLFQEAFEQGSKEVTDDPTTMYGALDIVKAMVHALSD